MLSDTTADMKTQIVKQIERRMEVLGLNQKSLAKKAGLNDTGVRDILEGRSRSPRHDTLTKLAKALGCTVGDLTGEPTARRPVSAEMDLAIVAINELDVHVAAGPSSSDDVAGLMAAHEASAVIGVHTYPAQSFREAFAVEPGRIRILAVRGDSMEPRLWAGQRVMVDIEDKTPSPPGIFVVWDGLGLVIKRVEVIAGSEPLRVRISSANPAYQAYERTLDEAHVNGRVIGTWSRT